MSPGRTPHSVGTCARAAVRGDAPGQRRHPTDVLQRGYDDLEALMRSMAETGRSRPSTERLDEEAHRIGMTIARAFRAPGTAQAVNPPLAFDGSGAWF